MTLTTDRTPENAPDGAPEGAAAQTPCDPAPAAPLAAHRGRRARWSVVALLVATTALYLVNLSASGYANSFYSAAVQAASVSWKAFFFGSSDAGNSITVDKPPASLWVMAASVKIFGLSSWSILVPQVLMGTATVGVLYSAVRRVFGHRAGMLAGVVLALTPVAALMFRFNNPDALLTLVMMLAVWASLRAIEPAARHRARWMVAVGLLVAFGFLTKQLQVLLVVPPIALAYLWASPVPLGRRVLHLFGAGAGLVVGAGWWIAIVSLWPASDRPYIGGSTTNSILELTLGYNGLGRLTGEQTGSVGGGGGWGVTGITRLFTGEIGGQITWLLPAALVLLLVGLVVRGRAPRTDAARASFVLFGSWLLVTAITFSFMAGIFHAYYTVALAPALAALVGAGASVLWALRSAWWATAVLAFVTAGTAAWASVLLARSADWLPWLRVVVVVLGVLAAVGFVAARALPRLRALAVPAAAVALVAALAGPTAYVVSTVSTPHTGSIVTAGPAVASATGFGGGGGPRGAAGFTGPPPGAAGQNGTPPAGTRGGTPPAGAPTGQDGGGRGGGGGFSGLLNGAVASDGVVDLLQQDASSYTWVAATTGSQNAANYQLATEDPVMPIGGFNGTDASPTLEQFQQHVADGEIHYYVVGDTGARGSDSSTASAASQISTWVTENFTATTVDGTTLYDLTATPSATPGAAATADTRTA